MSPRSIRLPAQRAIDPDQRIGGRNDKISTVQRCPGAPLLTRHYQT
ncbi:hypothetical protein USDA257_p01530 (plasmid) [Sinorhizobium fredii USDA 257]|uniref:Uncharacterized protein n=1 Tax=Sinorhizobium fredii (strain USDA 257) TaxID=1185652 RepID=I3XG64_SINF2|nr:hypothetical protein USDA257_p01530 [Sinorhizobium fredii USDA 257]